MNARDFLQLYGKDRAEEVAVKAGTNMRYYMHIARGKRRPSVELAERLIQASNHELDFVSLLKSKKQPAK